MIQPDENITSVPSLSYKYRSFIFSGFFRVIITRIFSLLYIFAITRIAPLEIQDNIIFLANGQWIIGSIAILGFTYSLTRKSIIENKTNPQTLYQGNSFLILFGIPLVLILSETIVLFTTLNLFDNILFLFSSIVYFFYNVVNITQDTLLLSNRKVILQSIFMVLNSILVPTFFLFNNSIRFVLIAWIMSLLIALLYEWKLIIKIVKNFDLKIKIGFGIFLYGFPIYIMSLFSIITTGVDSFILFGFFEVGSLAQYYWAFRLISVVLEVYFILLTGSFPILISLYVKKEINQFNQTIKSVYKIGVLIALFIFGSVYLGSSIIIITILSNEYINSIIYFELLAIAMFLRILPLLINQIFLARGNQRYLVENSIIVNISRWIFLILLVQFGPLGIAVVEICYSLVFLLYNSFRERMILKEILFLEKRFLIFIISFVIIILLLPISFDWTIYISVIILFVFVFIFLLYVLKPFKDYDIQLFESILGNKLRFGTKILNRFSIKNEKGI